MNGTRADYRQHYPALAGKSYFNYGGQGPLSQPAFQALQEAYTFEQREGPFSLATNDWILAASARTRQLIAERLKTLPDRIALTESTTAGMNIPLWGFPWRAGDELLLSDAEHPGIWAIVRALAARFDVRVGTVLLSQHPDPVAALSEALTPRTRMVVISHILWNSGRVLPLPELAAVCHQQGVLLHVDAAQSAGVMPLDLPGSQVDFYAFTGHKWWCGPAGVGALYISEHAQSQITPTVTGWRALYARGDARAFEVATSAWPLVVAWQTALTLHDQAGSIEERHRQQLDIARVLWAQLQSLPHIHCLNSDPPQSGLVPFTVSGWDAPQVERILAEEHIYVRSIPDPVCLRPSVHYFTSTDEIDHLITALNRLKP